MKGNNKVAGSVILYEPSLEQIRNYERYIAYLGKLYIFDNTKVPVEKNVKEMKRQRKIEYRHLGENQGVACALNCAADRAIKDGYDWLLTMDQDSVFEDNMAKRYFDFFNSMDDLQDVAILSPCHARSKTPESGNPLVELPVVMTSGNLLNLKLFKKIGQFEEKLFIDEVDHDYCLRARMQGCRILLLRNTYLNHKAGNMKAVRRGKDIIQYQSHSDERLYYITRNNLYMWKKYKRIFPEFIKSRQKTFVKQTLKNAIVFEKSINKLRYIVWGGLDYMVGKYYKR